ncbi:MAG: hypothetical protein ACXACI_02740 [Candidatus Hodarchaeales archaeon]|jgi:hypothetical protein
MLLSYMILEKNRRRVILTHEYVQKTLDEEQVHSFLKSLEGVIGTSFSADQETTISEISLWHGSTHYLLRWGEYIAGVFLTTIESKTFTTTLTETIFEVEGRFSDQLKAGAFSETLITDIGEVIAKNFSSIIFNPVDDLATVGTILDHKDEYYVHTGVEGFEIYETRKNGAAIGNFVNSYPTISFPALDEVVSILRTDLISLSDLEKRTRLLSPEDLALTLRQLLRLGIVECYTKPENPEAITQ